MRIENTLNVAKTAAIIVAKTGIRFMKIGMINTAAHRLQQQGRTEMNDVTNQLERGYTEKIAPKMKDFKLLKGKK